MYIRVIAKWRNLVPTAPRQISGQRLGYLDDNACRTGNQQILRQPPGTARN